MGRRPRYWIRPDELVPRDRLRPIAIAAAGSGVFVNDIAPEPVWVPWLNARGLATEMGLRWLAVASTAATWPG
jgi:hypothetical protein